MNAATFTLITALTAGAASADSPEVHYAPEERLDRIDVALIDNAETSINMAVEEYKIEHHIKDQ